MRVSGRLGSTTHSACTCDVLTVYQRLRLTRRPPRELDLLLNPTDSGPQILVCATFLQVAVVVKCAMTPYQAGIYNWVKTTGTLRLDPSHPLTGKSLRSFVPLNNKVMELRKVRAQRERQSPSNPK